MMHDDILVLVRYHYYLILFNSLTNYDRAMLLLLCINDNYAILTHNLIMRK